jgi:beta-aspartyl-peptidase (threonine type)
VWAIGLHGGVGPRREEDAAGDVAVFEAVLKDASNTLANGAAALDVVERAVRAMEDCGRFVAGKGSRPNMAGAYELDASICDGATRKVGSVAALSGVYPPIAIARAVMDKTDHVLLVGEGARMFALSEGFAAIEDPEIFFVREPSNGSQPDARPHGTVGAVALDISGNIAAGTSTGGTLGKRPGRVGDSPIVGAGSWADKTVGVSCMGYGEYFLRTAAAHSVAARCDEGGLDLQTALDRTIGNVGALGGDGGIVAVHANGEVRFTFNSKSMRVARANSSGLREAIIAKRN